MTTFNNGESGISVRTKINDAIEKVDGAQPITSADINGGTIDGTVIGGSTPAAISGTTITGTSFVTTGDMTFGDNDKAIFGAGSDLQIYHDGSASYISDLGTGNLFIQAGNFRLQNAAGTETMILANNDANVTLYYDNAPKLATTSTGIDVTGTVTADGLTVNKGSDGSDIVSLTGASAGRYLNIQSFTNSGAAGAGYDFNATSGQGAIQLSTVGNARLKVDNNGDISFYEDTGTTPKFFWDASAESLGIGTSSPAAQLHMAGQTNGTLRVDTSASGYLDLSMYSNGGFVATSAAQPLRLGTNNTERMRIDSSGNLLVGKTTAGDYVTGVEFQPAGAVLAYRTTGVAGIFGRTNDGEVIRITSNSAVVGSIGATSGDLYIGTGGIAARFDNSLNAITPFNNNTLANSDNVIGIGSSARRFKDLYLSGGVYLGGTGAANLLDDYEEGTWTPVISDATSGGNIGSATITDAVYTKIGRTVILGASLTNINTTGMTAANILWVRGIPFAAAASTLAVGSVKVDTVTFQGSRTYIYCQIGGGNSHLNFQVGASAVSEENVFVQDVSSGVSDIQFSITYTAA